VMIVRPDQHRVADPLRRIERPLQRAHTAQRSADSELDPLDPSSRRASISARTTSRTVIRCEVLVEP
jgi:hypothetical protein